MSQTQLFIISNCVMQARPGSVSLVYHVNTLSSLITQSHFQPDSKLTANFHKQYAESPRSVSTMSEVWQEIKEKYHGNNTNYRYISLRG